MPPSADPLLMTIYSFHAPVYGTLHRTFRLYFVPLVSESGNALPEIRRGHALLISYEFLNSVGLTFKKQSSHILLCFSLLLKIDSFLTQYILITVSPPSTPPSSSLPPFLLGSIPFLYLIRKQQASKR